MRRMESTVYSTIEGYMAAYTLGQEGIRAPQENVNKLIFTNLKNVHLDSFIAERIMV